MEELITQESKTKTAAFQTLGCKVNQDETEAMEAIFLKAGYQLVDFSEAADIYVINTCTVTHLSDRKSRQMIRRAKKNNANAIVVVTGCYAQVSKEEVMAIDDVDLVVGNNQKAKILEALEQFQGDKEKRAFVEDSRSFSDFEELPTERMIEKTRAYLKIQEGCEQFCTYCIIPYARGPLRSRSPESTLKEAKALEKAGFKELILTGIHLGAYGKEKLENAMDITAICRLLLAETTIPRIRLSSIEPTEVTAELIDLIKTEPRMCRHLHLPLQSGNDHVLADMRRPYTTEEYRQKIAEIRAQIPNIAISTDLLVGFPGESDDDFRKCLTFCDEMAFSGMHIFKYSPREGTLAANFPNQVDAADKESRSKKMADVAAKNAKRYAESFVGQTLLVLAEEQNAAGFWEGHTDNYLKIIFSGQCAKGDLVPVLINELSKKGLVGEIAGF